jgi:Dolichyl-phosphate-mannose-protein mannosyltransferase
MKLQSNFRLIFFKKIPFEIYLSFIWVLSILLVNPLGNFPLNDDWAYAKSVKILYENGNLVIGDWPGMTLIGQVLPGAFVSYFFGFSFVSLRFYTLIVSLVGAITFYNLAKCLSSNKTLTGFTTLLFLFNPLYFSLSFTFMTDVHFLTTMLLSLFFFYKYLIKRRYSFIILATLFSVVCTMIRQPGLLVPLGFAITVFFSGQNLMSKIRSSIPFIVTSLSLVIHSFWLSQSAESSASIVQFSDLIDLLYSLDLYHFLVRISKSILYVGLFSFPLIVLFWKDIQQVFKSKIKKSIVISIITILLLLIGGVGFPTGNILNNIGLGQKLLKDAYWGENLSPHINQGLWVILLKIISISTSLGLILLFFQKKHFRKRAEQNLTFPSNYNPLKLFIFITSVLYLGLIVLSASYFDRYTIPLFTFIILLLLPLQITITKAKRFIAINCLLLVVFFSISATHDYLSWNRARWDALNYLTEERKIKPANIDGGFEFNGWYLTGISTYGTTNKEDKSWWFVNNDEYVIAFGGIDGFQKIKGFQYQKILPFKNDSIYILHKEVN